jgi:ferredoxin|tara:strand:- start:200 stop:415 length:216 start_codon:yes stop_codon:yes gene_type:complete
VGYQIRLNIDDCMSSGKCVADYPLVFEFDDDELAFLKEGTALNDEDCIRVARNCPSRAISVFDNDGNEIPT